MLGFGVMNSEMYSYCPDVHLLPGCDCNLYLTWEYTNCSVIYRIIF